MDQCSAWIFLAYIGDNSDLEISGGGRMVLQASIVPLSEYDAQRYWVAYVAGSKGFQSLGEQNPQMQVRY